MSGWLVALGASSQTVVDVHRGAVLPEARVIVLAVPVAALLFYLFVVRRHRGH